jgi:hypothetical protein
VVLGELEVVERLEVEVGALADLAHGDVVLLGLAVGRLGLGEIGKHAEQLISPLVELAEPRLELLELGLERAGRLASLLEAGVVGLLGPRGLLDLRRQLVLLCPDLIDPRVELAAPLVDRDQLIELRRRPAPAERRADAVRVGADLLEVERGPAPTLVRGRAGWWSSPAATATR